MNIFNIDISNGYNQATLGLIIGYATLVFLISRSPKVLSTIPSFCAGIGVFFTFLVLYENLKGFNPPKGDDAFLKALVQELSAAFSTSIIGVFFSFLFNPVVKLWIDYLERKGYKGKDYIQKHPHELLHDIRISNDNLRNEISNLRGNNERATLEDIASSVNRLTDDTVSKLEKLFSSLDRRLKKTINALSDNAIQDAQQTVTDINQAFTARTAELLEQNLRDIASFFQEHKTFLEQTSEAFSKDSVELKRDIEATKSDFEEKVETIRKAFANGVENMAGKYQEESVNLTSIFEEVKSTLNNINDDIQQASQAVLENHLSKLDQTFTRIEEFQLTAQNNLQQTTREFAAAVEQYQLTSNEQGEILMAIRTQLEEFEKLRENSEELLNGWKQFSDEVIQMENRVADIANTISKLDDIHISLNGNKVKTES